MEECRTIDTFHNRGRIIDYDPSRWHRTIAV